MEKPILGSKNEKNTIQTKAMYLNLSWETDIYELGEMVINFDYKGQLACSLDKLK